MEHKPTFNENFLGSKQLYDARVLKSKIKDMPCGIGQYPLDCPECSLFEKCNYLTNNFPIDYKIATNE